MRRHAEDSGCSTLEAKAPSVEILLWDMTGYSSFFLAFDEMAREEIE